MSAPRDPASPARLVAHSWAMSTPVPLRRCRAATPTARAGRPPVARQPPDFDVDPCLRLIPVQAHFEYPFGSLCLTGLALYRNAMRGTRIPIRTGLLNGFGLQA